MPIDFTEMKSALSRLLRSPWLGAFILAVAVALLVVAVNGLSDPLPSWNSASRPAGTELKPFPLAEIERLLAPGVQAKISVVSNGQHAFFTRYFEPPPPPPPKPAPPSTPQPAPAPVPPPPTTRKVVLLYQGVYEAAAGQKKAFVLVEAALHVLTNGAKVLAGWSVADIGLRQLMLTNAAAQTNLLEFKIGKELEVPIK